MIAILTVGATAAQEGSNQQVQNQLVAKAEATLRRAASFFRETISVRGSYVWAVSPDLSFRRGEAKTTPTQGWVQPPGTPSVGLAYVKAFQATGDPYYLEAAVDAARALAATQLVSGGWHAAIEFDEERKQIWCYRALSETCDKTGPRKDNRYRNASYIDDDITQSAIRLLILVDSLVHGSDSLIGESVHYGLQKLIDTQYPNGAWPIRFDQRVSEQDIEARIGAKGRYPDAWSREFTDVPSPEFFVLNDHVLASMIRTLLLAHRHYGDGRYLQSAMRAGDFLLAAQMPEPQPAWSQVYNSSMEPIWGRKFEPPSVASWETASTIQVLLDLHAYTGQQRYLDAIEPAANWLEASKIGEGLWARFYELETNTPLYMTTEYQLTYKADDLPRHYGFQGRFDIPETLTAYRKMRDLTDRRGPANRGPSTDISDEVQMIVAALDSEGRWLEDNMILSQVFVDNVDTLSLFIAAAKGRQIVVEELFR